ncbi:hypothetical protein CLF_106828 [Clonorchis sinensis]|uniref:Uncharacterized protein n=1 Tax=Clonorchis sinensis TaxID=79923 RepID=G7YFT1_CLOSI|nr:hypothetical protein CLF_106828 [Clonorchis sinensis]
MSADEYRDHDNRFMTYSTYVAGRVVAIGTAVIRRILACNRGRKGDFRDEERKNYFMWKIQEAAMFFQKTDSIFSQEQRKCQNHNPKGAEYHAHWKCDIFKITLSEVRDLEVVDVNLRIQHYRVEFDAHLGRVLWCETGEAVRSRLGWCKGIGLPRSPDLWKQLLQRNPYAGYCIRREVKPETSARNENKNNNIHPELVGFKPSCVIIMLQSEYSMIGGISWYHGPAEKRGYHKEWESSDEDAVTTKQEVADHVECITAKRGVQTWYCRRSKLGNTRKWDEIMAGVTKSAIRLPDVLSGLGGEDRPAKQFSQLEQANTKQPLEKAGRGGGNRGGSYHRDNGNRTELRGDLDQIHNGDQGMVEYYVGRLQLHTIRWNRLEINSSYTEENHRVPKFLCDRFLVNRRQTGERLGTCMVMLKHETSSCKVLQSVAGHDSPVTVVKIAAIGQEIRISLAAGSGLDEEIDTSSHADVESQPPPGRFYSNLLKRSLRFNHFGGLSVRALHNSKNVLCSLRSGWIIIWLNDNQEEPCMVMVVHSCKNVVHALGVTREKVLLPGFVMQEDCKGFKEAKGRYEGALLGRDRRRVSNCPAASDNTTVTIRKVREVCSGRTQITVGKGSVQGVVKTFGVSYVWDVDLSLPEIANDYSVWVRCPSDRNLQEQDTHITPAFKPPPSIFDGLRKQLIHVVDKLRGQKPRRSTTTIKQLTVQGQILLRRGSTSVTMYPPSMAEETAPQPRWQSTEAYVGSLCFVTC